MPEHIGNIDEVQTGVCGVDSAGVPERMRVRATEIRGARVLPAGVVDRLRADVRPGDSSWKEKRGLAGAHPQLGAEQLQGRRVQPVDARTAPFQSLHA